MVFKFCALSVKPAENLYHAKLIKVPKLLQSRFQNFFDAISKWFVGSSNTKTLKDLVTFYRELSGFAPPG